MSKVFVIANQKGGVGKTTTTINLSAFLAQKGKKVLIIDLDPQSNATSGLGIDTKATDKDNTAQDLSESESIYHVLLGQTDIPKTFRGTNIDNLFIVPASLSLAGAEIELVNTMSRETVLQSAIEKVKDQYDYILIDCPPSLGLLTINALVAADKAIIPVQSEYFALEGLGQLLETVKLIKKLNPSLEIGGVVITMYDMRTRLSQQVADEVKNYFGDVVFKSKIPRNVRLSEAPSYGKPIMLYDPNSAGSSAYQKLALEFIERF